MIVELAAIIGGTIVLVTGVSLHYASKINGQELELNSPTIDGYPVHRHAGPVNDCPACGRKYSGKRRFLPTFFFAQHKANNSWASIQEALDKTRQKEKDDIHGPTGALAYTTKSKHSMLYQACSDCGGEWLVYPASHKFEDQEDFSE